MAGCACAAVSSSARVGAALRGPRGGARHQACVRGLRPDDGGYPPTRGATPSRSVTTARGALCPAPRRPRRRPRPPPIPMTRPAGPPPTYGGQGAALGVAGLAAPAQAHVRVGGVAGLRRSVSAPVPPRSPPPLTATGGGACGRLRLQLGPLQRRGDLWDRRLGPPSSERPRANEAENRPNYTLGRAVGDVPGDRRGSRRSTSETSSAASLPSFLAIFPARSPGQLFGRVADPRRSPRRPRRAVGPAPRCPAADARPIHALASEMSAARSASADRPDTCSALWSASSGTTVSRRINAAYDEQETRGIASAAAPPSSHPLRDRLRVLVLALVAVVPRARRPATWHIRQRDRADRPMGAAGGARHRRRSRWSTGSPPTATRRSSGGPAPRPGGHRALGARHPRLRPRRRTSAATTRPKGCSPASLLLLWLYVISYIVCSARRSTPGRRRDGSRTPRRGRLCRLVVRGRGRRHRRRTVRAGEEKKVRRRRRATCVEHEREPDRRGRACGRGTATARARRRPGTRGGRRRARRVHRDGEEHRNPWRKPATK